MAAPWPGRPRGSEKWNGNLAPGDGITPAMWFEEVRRKFRERRLARLARQAPAVAYPLGSGPPNRHGMPRVPIGQRVVEKWPVLDLGRQPLITEQEWRLRLDGECDNPLLLTWEEFMGLDQVEESSDFHCVTGWSRLDMPWQGVRLARLAELCQVRRQATHLLCHAYDGYQTNFALGDPDVLLVHSADGQPLSVEHGGPVRVITPRLYAWKGAKWVCRLEFLSQDRPGYWERNGYSNSADPWADDRFS